MQLQNNDFSEQLFPDIFLQWVRKSKKSILCKSDSAANKFITYICLHKFTYAYFS